jgi:hypothetical protein
MSSDGKYQVVNGNDISYLSSDYGISWKSTSKLGLYITRDGKKLISGDQVSIDFGVRWITIKQDIVGGWGDFNVSSNAKTIIQSSFLYTIV